MRNKFSKKCQILLKFGQSDTVQHVVFTRQGSWETGCDTVGREIVAEGSAVRNQSYPVLHENFFF